LKNSPQVNSRSDAARILANGFDPNREIEEALVNQLLNESGELNARSSIFSELSKMAMTDGFGYEKGFLYAPTEKLMVDCPKRSRC
ncbi:hypothetical protein JYT96_03140, partial [Gammaproteobacteria bacterium AH-315-C21]|nr:hypothetical protein [Gammaproteobacteria bacterium AH-315-C21]